MQGNHHHHHHHYRLSFSSLVVFTLFCLPIAFNPLGSASTSLSKYTLGIAPQDANYFKSDIIKCKDGSKKFTKAQLNDDFCDCPDGTDEPVDDNSNTRVEAESGQHVGSSPSGQPLEKEKDGSESTEELSKLELGRFVASRWTGENAGKETKVVSSDSKEEHDGDQDNKHDEDYDGYNSDTDEEQHKYDEDDIDDTNMDDEVGEQEDYDSSVSYEPDSEDQTDFSDISTSSNPSWLDKIQRTVRNILQAVNLFQTPIDKSGKPSCTCDDSSKKLSKILSQISSLDQKLKHDFGTENEFYSFYNRCFKIEQNKYVYKVCPFKEASQVEGHSTTQLGSILGVDLNLSCHVDEPSRCEYVALMSTPVFCREDKLKELQRKLDSLDSEQRQSHDEL